MSNKVKKSLVKQKGGWFNNISARIEKTLY
jgi:hypothetical protein